MNQSIRVASSFQVFIELFANHTCASVIVVLFYIFGNELHQSQNICEPNVGSKGKAVFVKSQGS